MRLFLLLIMFTTSHLTAAYAHTCTDDLLLDDAHILHFVSHPKAWHHFMQGQQELRTFALTYTGKVNQLKVKYPDNLWVEKLTSSFRAKFDRFKHPSPFDPVIGPLLTFGIANTQAITDAEILADLQSTQIKIFKNWLSRYHIGEPNPDMLLEMRDYARRTPLDLFQQILLPVFESIQDYDIPVNIYLATDPIFHLLPSEQEQDSDESLLSIKEEVDALSEELTSAFDPIFNAYYSRDAMILLFLEINDLLMGESPCVQENPPTD